LVTIGTVKLGEFPLLLAPMEDVSDPPFRRLCKAHGVDMMYTEFISVEGLIRDADKSVRKLEIFKDEKPVGIQIFGAELDSMLKATDKVTEACPDVLDINFGCPVKKVVCKDGGAGILRNIPKMMEITKAVVEVSSKPVTVKTRLGWNDESLQIVDVAKRLEDCGIQALAVHARTRKQMYKGEARWEWLRKIKQESGIAIPLIGNGDASSPEKIKLMFEETGVDGVMIGRGAIGNPWIFSNFKSYMETGVIPESPSWDEKIAIVTEHLRMKCEWLGERKGVLEMRRMYGGYFKGFRNASALRTLIMQESSLDGVLEVIDKFDINDDSVSHRVKREARSLSSKELSLPKPVSV